MPVFSILNAVILAAMLAFSHGLLKWVASQPSVGPVQGLLRHWEAIAVAVGIYVLIFVYYLFALRFVPLSTLYPAYTGISIGLVYGVGVFAFGETTSGWQAAGCLLIVIGVFLVAGSAS